MDNSKYIDRALGVAESFLKGRFIFRLSAAWIASGVSILGFGNFAPYLLLTVRPELAEKIGAQSDALTAIAIAMILFGSMIPIFIKVYDYYLVRYRGDLDGMDVLLSKCAPELLKDDLIYIELNLCMTHSQQDRMSDLYEALLWHDFKFHDKSLHGVAKKFGSVLSSLDGWMAYKFYPHGNHAYHVPLTHQSDELREELSTRFDAVRQSLNGLLKEMERVKSNVLFRYFA